MASTSMLAGKCECGAVRYRVPDEFLYAANCHCSNCRAGTGSAFKPFAGIEREKLQVTEGQDTLLVWGDDPPYHTPVFVLTHHAREPVEMQGGTTFHFVTDGIEAALERAREAAGGLDVSIGGGAATVQQYLRVGLVDEMRIHVVPVLLGGGERLFDDVGGAIDDYELVELVSSPAAAHFTYRRRGKG